MSIKDIVENLFDGDNYTAQDLFLYISSDRDLHSQNIIPIRKNLVNKMEKGIFDFEKSVKLWMHLVDAGAKKYNVEFGPDDAKVFDRATRLAVAEELAKEFVTEYELGNYDELKKSKREALQYSGDEMWPGTGNDPLGDSENKDEHCGHCGKDMNESDGGSLPTEWGTLHYRISDDGITFYIDDTFDKAGLKEEADQKGLFHVESELFDHLMANGWDWIRPEDVGGLTDAPIISDSAIYNDQGELESVDYVYWYPNYQVGSIVDDLVDSDESFWPKVQGEKEESIDEDQKLGKVGQRVRVSAGSGVDSNKLGTVVDKSEVETDGRGVPTNVSGAYKPVDWKRELAVRLDSGELILMFKDRLFPVEEESMKENRSLSSKFDHWMDQFAWQLSMDGATEELGDSETFGYYVLLTWGDPDHMVEDFNRVAADINAEPLTPEEIEEIKSYNYKAVILMENSQGFVFSDWFEDEATATEAWQAIADEWEKYHEDSNDDDL